MKLKKARKNIHKDLKRCSKCRKPKEFKEFRKCSKAKARLKAYCILCDNQYQKDNYRANKSRRLEQIKKWQRENKERIKGYRNKINNE